MDLYWLILGILAVWRVTHLLQAEDGPWDIVARLRACVGSGFWGKLLDCFQCLSLWVALPPGCLIGRGWSERIFLWLAFSGGAILLEQLTKRVSEPPPAMYYEDKENEDVVLRRSEETVPGSQAKPPAV